MYKNPVTTVNALANNTQLSIPTINKAISNLLKDNIIIEITGNRRNRIFALYKYISVFEKS